MQYTIKKLCVNNLCLHKCQCLFYTDTGYINFTLACICFINHSMLRNCIQCETSRCEHLSVKQNRCEPSQRETYLGAKHPEVKCAIDLHRIYANIIKLDTTIN